MLLYKYKDKTNEKEIKKIIKENLKKGQLISGTGRVYHFSSKIYLQAAKFLMKKFNLSLKQAKSQLNFYIVTARIWKNGKIVEQFESNKKSTNARLKNIYELNYEWNELIE